MIDFNIGIIGEIHWPLSRGIHWRKCTVRRGRFNTTPQLRAYRNCGRVGDTQPDVQPRRQGPTGASERSTSKPHTPTHGITGQPQHEAGKSEHSLYTSPIGREDWSNVERDSQPCCTARASVSNSRSLRTQANSLHVGFGHEALAT